MVLLKDIRIIVKAIVCYARFWAQISLLDICKKEQILSFLDTKIKNSEQDPEKKWINIWNDYARRIKHFLRWLHNTKKYGQEVLHHTEWITPPFAKIKEKGTKRSKSLLRKSYGNVMKLFLLSNMRGTPAMLTSHTMDDRRT